MKKYIMEIMHEQNDLPSGKYKTVVTVDEAGNYHQYNETEDINGEMVRFTEYKKSIFEMGWKSLTDFLKGRMPEYKVIEMEEKMKLYLNGCYLGECLGYHQQRDENGNKWIFEIENKKPFSIAFEMIKSFTSSGELRIITKAKPAEESGDPIPKEEKSK